MSVFGFLMMPENSGMLDVRALKDALRTIPDHAEITSVFVDEKNGRHCIRYACILHDPGECMSEVDDPKIIDIDLTQYGGMQ